MYKAINFIASLCLITVGLSACGDNSSEENVTITPPVETSDCFWQGPYVKENPATNFAFPDTGAHIGALNIAYLKVLYFD